MTVVCGKKETSRKAAKLAKVCAGSNGIVRISSYYVQRTQEVHRIRSPHSRVLITTYADAENSFASFAALREAFFTTGTPKRINHEKSEKHEKNAVMVSVRLTIAYAQSGFTIQQCARMYSPNTTKGISYV